MTRILLLADGWHAVDTLTWPTFRGAPGYAARIGDRWLVGPVTAVLAVESDDEILDAVLTELPHAARLDDETLVDMLARLVEDVAADRLQSDRTAS